jgi:hypothetical protein
MALIWGVVLHLPPFPSSQRNAEMHKGYVLQYRYVRVKYKEVK